MVKSQFSYCPLVWMFSSRKANNLINRIRERSIRIVWWQKKEMTKKKEMTICQRNLQVLVIEVYKIINWYAPTIIDNFFIFRENKHSLRSFQILLNKRCLPGSSLRKKGFRKVFSVWTKSHFSNFEVGWQTFPWSRKCMSVVLK